MRKGKEAHWNFLISIMHDPGALLEVMGKSWQGVFTPAGESRRTRPSEVERDRASTSLGTDSATYRSRAVTDRGIPEHPHPP